MSIKTLSILGIVALAAPVASAHPGHTSDAPWITGILHPLTGIDHLLAIFAVGLLAVQMGRRWMWALPPTFVAFMIVGSALAMSGAALPLLEPGIMASVLVLGLMSAAAGRLPVAVPVALVALFATFHGYAHIAERPVAPSMAAYAAGFIGSTLAL